MIFKCKVKPTKDTCLTCMHGKLNYDLPGECDTCEEMNKEYIIMQLGTNKNEGDYAFVMHDGKIQRVSLDRVEGVKVDYWIPEIPPTKLITNNCIIPGDPLCEK